MPKKIIAFTGPKGVGKTSLAKTVQSLSDSCEIISFAKPIKDMIRAMGIDEDSINNPEKKDLKLDWVNCSPREIMQTLGTEWGRNMIDQEIWLKLARKKIEDSNAKIVLIDDCRFDNESDMIQEIGGYVIELYRPHFDTYTEEHESEKGVRYINDHMNVDALDAAAKELISMFNL